MSTGVSEQKLRRSLDPIQVRTSRTPSQHDHRRGPYHIGLIRCEWNSSVDELTISQPRKR
jgi:hypothetical protein